MEAVARIAETLPPRRSRGPVATLAITTAVCALVAMFAVFDAGLDPAPWLVLSAVTLAIVAAIGRRTVGEGAPRAVAIGFALVLPWLAFATYAHLDVAVVGASFGCGWRPYRFPTLPLLAALTCGLATWWAARRPRPSIARRVPGAGPVMLVLVALLAGLVALAGFRVATRPTKREYRESLASTEYARIAGVVGENGAGCVVPDDADACELPAYEDDALLLQRVCSPTGSWCELLVTLRDGRGPRPISSMRWIAAESDIVVRRDEARGLWVFDATYDPPRMETVGAFVEGSARSNRGVVQLHELPGALAPASHAAVLGGLAVILLGCTALWIGPRRRRLRHLLSGADGKLGPDQWIEFADGAPPVQLDEPDAPPAGPVITFAKQSSHGYRAPGSVRDPQLVTGSKAHHVAKLASVLRDLRPVVIVIALYMATPLLAAAAFGLVF